MPNKTLARAIATAVILVPVAANGQRALTLERPVVVSTEQFGLVNSVRELSNGSMLVADPLGGDLWLLDAGLRSQRKIGREGSGPGEFRQPDAVWAARGDTTLLVDLGNARLSYLDASGTFVRSISMILGQFTPGSGAPPASIIPRGTDDRGRIYFQGSPTGPRGISDSIKVMRFDPVTRRVDTLAAARAPDFDRQESGNTDQRQVRIRPVPLSGADGWAVGRDGGVAIARVAQYRIDWIGPDGRLRPGAPNSWEQAAIGAAEREEWAEQQSLSGGIGMSVENRDGEIAMSFSRARAGSRPATEGLRFPSHKPPFDNGSMVVDRSGRLWVQRNLPARRSPRYDVFSREGALVAIVTFPAGRRLVGFGSQGLYATATDDDGLQRIERYAVPLS
ncbi:MAG: hypothetical protein ACT4OZ_12085 [Gemmatimonadota bacterium]